MYSTPAPDSPRLTIAGLGPGCPDLVPHATISAARSASKVLVRTRNHPAIAALEDAGIQFEDFDCLYDEAPDFDRLYALIADRVLESARTQDTVYVVPGNPLLAERTVELILAMEGGREARIIPAAGFTEAVLLALKVPASSGYALVDAYDIYRGLVSTGPSAASPTIVFQTHDQVMMSAVKLWLLEHLPAEQEVFIVHAAGAGALERVVKLAIEDLDRAGIAGPLTSVFIPPVASTGASPDGEGAWLRFLSVMAALRGEHGCPWDKEQTYESLTRYLLEEAHEVVSSALEKDADKLKEELGDLLLEIGLYCQIATERGDFQPNDVLSGITQKLVRRHPHVFGDEKLLSSGEVRERWAQIKREEPGRYEEGHSLMDEVQRGLPALMKAQRQQALAGDVGFDWESADPVLHKVREELGELDRARNAGKPDDIKAEVGDLLFACVNLARKLGVDAETALLGTVEKFSRRFRLIERELAKRDLSMKEQTLEFLDALWEKAKEQEGKKEGWI
jgi:tetrapyrrole methylase family protein/MazG family protein